MTGAGGKGTGVPPDAKAVATPHADAMRATIGRLFEAKHRADVSAKPEDISAFAAITDKICGDFETVCRERASARQAAFEEAAMAVQVMAEDGLRLAQKHPTTAIGQRALVGARALQGAAASIRNLAKAKP